MLGPHRYGEPPADHVPKDVVDSDIRSATVHSKSFECIEHGEDAASGATDPRLGASGLDAHDPSGAGDCYIIQGALGRRCGADIVQNGGLLASSYELPGGVVLGVASDLHDGEAFL